MNTGYCVVIDLDETLVHTVEDIKLYKELGISKDPKLIDIRSRSYVIGIDNIEGDGKRMAVWGTKRPHLERFLIFCFSFFDVVAVWSAGTNDYVRKIVNVVFRNIQRPHIVWSREKVLMDEDGQKPLQKMIKEHPTLEGIMRLDNTIIIDDKDYTFQKCNPYNAIMVPEYNPFSSIESIRSDDISLLQIIAWVLSIDKGEDIRSKDKSLIFKKSPYAQWTSGL